MGMLATAYTSDALASKATQGACFFFLEYAKADIQASTVLSRVSGASHSFHVVLRSKKMARTEQVILFYES